MPAIQPDRCCAPGIAALERALAILRLFTSNDDPRSLTEIARAVGLSPATTHRIVATLVRERLLANDAATERYQIGPDSLFLFAAAARRYGIAAARSGLAARSCQRSYRRSGVHAA